MDASPKRMLTPRDWVSGIAVLLLLIGIYVLAENVDRLSYIDRHAFAIALAVLGLHSLRSVITNPRFHPVEKASIAICTVGAYVAVFLPGHHLADVFAAMAIIEFGGRWIGSLYRGHRERRS